MYQDERKLNFKPFGHAIKKAREAKGWTQEYLAQLVDLTPRSIMYIENRGQHPSLNKFYQLVTLLDLPVDQFFFSTNSDKDCNRRTFIILAFWIFSAKPTGGFFFTEWKFF